MTKAEVEKYISENYGAEAEHPWADSPDNTVFRHRGNRKWFALTMNVGREKLGLSGEGSIGLMNLKCDPILIGSFVGQPGFFPAWHMNKSHWISVALDGSAGDEDINWLLDVSYDLTKPKRKCSKKETG